MTGKKRAGSENPEVLIVERIRTKAWNVDRARVQHESGNEEGIANSGPELLAIMPS